MPGILSKIKEMIGSFFITPQEWQRIEYFDENWKKRVAKMASYITPGKSIMDLGCGEMYLRDYLNNNYYIPVDYTKRDDNTIICNFNKKEFPKVTADICFISGCLEYVKEYGWFVDEICNHCDKVILSYCTTDEFPNMVMRKRNSWVNHLSANKIKLLFKKNNFRVKEIDYTYNSDQVFIFEKS